MSEPTPGQPSPGLPPGPELPPGTDPRAKRPFL